MADKIADFPRHIVVKPWMDGVGNSEMCKVSDAIILQPCSLVTVTVYVPAVETVKTLLLEPLDQRYVRGLLPGNW